MHIADSLTTTLKSDLEVTFAIENAAISDPEWLRNPLLLVTNCQQMVNMFQECILLPFSMDSDLDTNLACADFKRQLNELRVQSFVTNPTVIATFVRNKLLCYRVLSRQFKDTPVFEERAGNGALTFEVLVFYAYLKIVYEALCEDVDVRNSEGSVVTMRNRAYKFLFPLMIATHSATMNTYGSRLVWDLTDGLCDAHDTESPRAFDLSHGRLPSWSSEKNVKRGLSILHELNDMNRSSHDDRHGSSGTVTQPISHKWMSKESIHVMSALYLDIPNVYGLIGDVDFVSRIFLSAVAEVERLYGLEALRYLPIKMSRIMLLAQICLERDTIGDANCRFQDHGPHEHLADSRDRIVSNESNGSRVSRVSNGSRVSSDSKMLVDFSEIEARLERSVADLERVIFRVGRSMGIEDDTSGSMSPKLV